MTTKIYYHWIDFWQKEIQSQIDKKQYADSDWASKWADGADAQARFRGFGDLFADKWRDLERSAAWAPSTKKANWVDTCYRPFK